jgi:hypothetical protein
VAATCVAHCCAYDNDKRVKYSFFVHISGDGKGTESAVGKTGQDII